jgi:integrase
MSVRKREWTTPKGEARTAWVVDYVDRSKQRHLKTFAKKRDADDYEAKVKVEIGKGIHTAGSTTVAQAGELWLQSRELAGVERTTLVHYRECLNLHIVPLIGSMKLADLTLPALTEFEDRLRREGRSPSAVKRILTRLSGLLGDAQTRGFVAQNIVRTRPRNGHAIAARQRHRLEIGVDIPTLDEVGAIIAKLDGEGRERALILTAIFTGLRSSELRGLRWQDVDLAKGELCVRQRADEFGAIGKPKSAAGQRAVPMLPMLVAALREWKLACPPNDLDLVFPGHHGPLALTTLISFNWHPLQLRAGIVTSRPGRLPRPKYGGLHALRHFFASWCINPKESGGLELSGKVVQSRLGHATITMTMDRYSHLFPRGDDSAEMAAAEQAFLSVVK